MSVPKKRRTKSSVGKRRSHHSLKKITLNKCSKCGKALLPHRACSFCGTYKGKQIFKIKTIKAKKEK
ncbi:MAG: 50S ribosomal protein L32 [Patescibacteria group bacterium]